jgi:hypothetical protein
MFQVAPFVQWLEEADEESDESGSDWIMTHDYKKLVTVPHVNKREGYKCRRLFVCE